MTRKAITGVLSDVGIAGGLALIVVLVQPRGPIGRQLVAEWHERTVAREVKRDWPALAWGLRLDTGSGPVQIVEFADYECPFCRATYRQLSKVIAENPNLGVVYRDYPLAIHPEADAAAAASICAAAQGRFRQMHDQLYEHAGWMSHPRWSRQALAAGVPDTAAFSRCVESERTAKEVNAESRLGDEVDVSGTPTFFFSNGRRHVGAMTTQQIMKELNGVHPSVK